MDNPQNSIPEQITALIEREVAHHVSHEMSSPQVTNRLVGETMRHIGSFLHMSSGPYLPVRPEEILITPAELGSGSDDAVLLVRRTMHSQNSFLVIAKITNTAEEGKRKIDITNVRVDDFNLPASKFVGVSEPISRELLRQINLLANSEGSLLVHCVIVKDYFKSQKKQQEELFSSEASAVIEPAAPGATPEPVAVSGLPPVIENPELL